MKKIAYRQRKLKYILKSKEEIKASNTTIRIYVISKKYPIKI
jgi:hypothetical protein